MEETSGQNGYGVSSPVVAESRTEGRTAAVGVFERCQVPIAFLMLLSGQWYCIALYLQRALSWQERLPEFFALLTAAWLIHLREDDSGRRSVSPGILVLPILVVAATFGRVPELLSLILGTSVILLLLWRTRLASHVGIWGLVLLGLPVLSRLPLFLGYPMRVATGMLAAPFLRIGGLNVVREGTVFRLGERMVVIDAPCSGTNMLWAAVWVTLTLAVLKSVSNRRTVALLLLSAGLVIVANAIRSAALVLTKVRGFEVSPTMHSGVGLMCYAALLGAIAMAIFRIAPDSKPKPVLANSLPAKSSSGPQWFAFTLACIVCAVAPLFLPAAQAGTMDEPAWPTTFGGKPLTRVELQPYEQRYAAQFPGRMARFSDGSRQIMFQWLPTHSRSVHSASQCLQNVGYLVEHGPIIVDESGVRWSSCEARRGATAIRLRERIEDAHGGHWQDVSSWYWDATLGRSRGPYWVVIVTEPL